jgi:hypothetical protein
MEDFSTTHDLSAALNDAVALFEQLRIDYALIGGLASMYYGRARFTDDVDFIAASGHEAVLAAHPEAMREHHFDPNCTWKLYHASGAEVDVWKDVHVNDMISRAVTATLAGRSVRIAEAHDVVAMKLRADRPQDDYDVSEILKHVPIEDERVRERVTAEQYEHYLQIKRRSGR